MMLYENEYNELFNFTRTQNLKLLNINQSYEYNKNIIKVNNNIKNFENSTNMIIEELINMYDIKLNDYKKEKEKFNNRNKFSIIKFLNKKKLYKEIKYIKKIKKYLRLIKNNFKKDVDLLLNDVSNMKGNK